MYLSWQIDPLRLLGFYLILAIIRLLIFNNQRNSVSDYKVSVIKQALIECYKKENKRLSEVIMKFEVDGKVLDKLKEKAEREDLELQALLEKFADS